MAERGYMLQAQSTDWQTPKDLFDRLWDEFGPFDLDPCGQREHHYTAWRIAHKGGGFYDGSTEAMDGLLQPWYGKVYMNPPYGREMPKWIDKAVSEVECGNAELVVALIPSRTDTKVWQRYIVRGWAGAGMLHAHPRLAELHFLPGRLKFGGATGPAPFPSAVVVWRQQ